MVRLAGLRSRLNSCHQRHWACSLLRPSLHLAAPVDADWGARASIDPIHLHTRHLPPNAPQGGRCVPPTCVVRCAMYCTRATLCSGVTSVTSPKSSTQILPSTVRMRLPGWGSAEAEMGQGKRSMHQRAVDGANNAGCKQRCGTAVASNILDFPVPQALTCRSDGTSPATCLCLQENANNDIATTLQPAPARARTAHPRGGSRCPAAG
jgi:hypothetical protein